MNRIRFEWSIPNALSFLRLMLVPLFAWLYLSAENSEGGRAYWAFGVLALSALTDTVDGAIARHFNQQTEFGKLIDPLSDKITQVGVMACLALKNRVLIPLSIICFIKEALQAIGFALLYKRIGADGLEGSKWFGKVSTFIFYATVLLIVIWDEMPAALFMGLVALVTLCMVFALINYVKLFVSMKRAIPTSGKAERTEKATQNMRMRT